MNVKVFSRISDVPATDWDSLANGYSSSYSRAFWHIIEHAGLNDFDYQHAIFYDAQGTPVAITTFYSVTTDLAIFSTGKLKAVLGAIRKVFPGFMKLKMLECGTPITINAPFVARAASDTRTIIESLHDLLRSTARKNRQHLIVVRDFEARSDDLLPAFRQQGYHIVDSLPTTYLDITWKSTEEYLASMKSYYRSKLLKHLRINAQQGIRHERHDDFHALADTLCQQWLVVHDHASEYQREVLSPRFYRDFSQQLGSQSQALLFYRNDELIGHALLLLDGKMLRWLYFGRTEACNDSLYIHVAYAVVEAAIELEADVLELGLTTYSIKKDLGAQMSPNRLALRATWRLANPLVGIFYPLLNQVPDISNKNIFKKR